jgi:hypothetical protein
VSVLRDMLAGKVCPPNFPFPKLGFISKFFTQARLTPQHHSPSAPCAPPITPADAFVDFTTMNAEDIVRRHRALSHQVCGHLEVFGLFAEYSKLETFNRLPSRTEYNASATFPIRVPLCRPIHPNSWVCNLPCAFSRAPRSLCRRLCAVHSKSKTGEQGTVGCERVVERNEIDGIGGWRGNTVIHKSW